MSQLSILNKYIQSPFSSGYTQVKSPLDIPILNIYMACMGIDPYDTFLYPSMSSMITYGWNMNLSLADENIGCYWTVLPWSFLHHTNMIKTKFDIKHPDTKKLHQVVWHVNQ